MISVSSERGRRILGRLERGDELHAGLLRACEQHGVKTGFVRAIGACEAAELTEFDPEACGYRAPLRLEGFHELVALNGNVSMRAGKPFLHLHAMLTSTRRDSCQTYGGHLMSARVFALEFEIASADDVTLERHTEPVTQLALWEKPE